MHLKLLPEGPHREEPLSQRRILDFQTRAAMARPELRPCPPSCLGQGMVLRLQAAERPLVVHHVAKQYLGMLAQPGSGAWGPPRIHPLGRPLGVASGLPGGWGGVFPCVDRQTASIDTHSRSLSISYQLGDTGAAGVCTGARRQQLLADA
jgi:hypothetical protein